MITIVGLSDTHGLHRQVDLPPADILVHCGDITMKGEEHIYEDFCNWMQEQKDKYKHRLVICGNHDFKHEKFAKNASQYGITYLEHSGVQIEGIHFYGVPNVSNLPRWAFDDSGDPECWSRIPNNTQVLISHSPPFRILDELWQYGSKKLRERVLDLMERRLEVNVFGHCHDDGSKRMILNAKSGRPVQFVNACICDVKYRASYSPMMIEYEHRL